MFRVTKKTTSSSTNDVMKASSTIARNEKIFNNLNVYLMPNGMGKNRCELFKNALLKHGAILIDENNELKIDDASGAYLIIVDENSIQTWQNLEKVLNKKKIFTVFKDNSNDVNVHVLKSTWLSECLKQSRRIDWAPYEIRRAKKDDSDDLDKRRKNAERIFSDENIEKNGRQNDLDTICDTNREIKLNINFKRNASTGKSSDEDDMTLTKKVKTCPKLNDQTDNSSSYSSSDSEEASDFFDKELQSKSKRLLNSKAWTCAHSSNESRVNVNKHITDKLEEMSTIYENTKDKYRALGYQKAILALKRLPHPIKTREEAMSIPGVGSRIADKIWEIVETGNLRKLDELSSRDDINSVKLFTNVHGIGPTTAQYFIAQGFRTLDDLRTKANLTKQQKIGLKYYDEFLQRIPRDEVAKIENIVKETALSLNDGLIVQTCGSYRRGKATCGDVDILITHPDGHSQRKIFTKLIEKLHEINFLTDDLAMQDEASSETQNKYLGVCILPEPNSLHRRLDIIIVPYDQYACALIYFTGSAHFNRSMRHLAGKLGLSLTEKSLNKHVIRKGSEKINDGEVIPTRTEEDVFKYLNIPFRPPLERDF